MLGTETESFPTNHSTYGLEYKSIEKHRKMKREKITDFGLKLCAKNKVSHVAFFKYTFGQYYPLGVDIEN